jgi:hypothetical protein
MRLSSIAVLCVVGDRLVRPRGDVARRDTHRVQHRCAAVMSVGIPHVNSVCDVSSLSPCSAFDVNARPCRRSIAHGTAAHYVRPLF